ncbi:potassium-transporting ATPase subunit KdpC [Aureimonas ureilytica]|uniref:potassium-transporting ATPase subunit KdpC n=1 Tax=Aureimonas ureilytica TaxID=401562 RepID=UPI00037767F6|nr:potassium-transporting ATPase subunit KdpC [Aureimonas ureilytica]
MLQHLRAAATLLGLFTVLLGLAYPAGMTALASLAFPDEARGSLVSVDGQPVGSLLVGQGFKDAAYLQPRPSSAGAGYDASSSSGSNLGPTSAKLAERLRTDAEALRAATGAKQLPADAITSSGSGLDPDVSPAFAALQAARIAAARGVAAPDVQRLIDANTAGRTFGVLGEPRVNVLAVNLALDRLAPRAAPAQGGTPTASVN